MNATTGLKNKLPGCHATARSERATHRAFYGSSYLRKYTQQAEPPVNGAAHSGGAGEKSCYADT